MEMPDHCDKSEVKSECSGGIICEETAMGKLECAICLQTCIHPVCLPCRHIFCFLCVKGVTNQSKRCAMCRQEIPANYLDNPQLVTVEEIEPDIVFEDGYQWFYEGRNGWWQYDERTSVEMETAYKHGHKRCEVLIAGFLYIIDFEHMVQVRRCDPSRRRHIKRDLASVPKKGVAGIRIPSSRTLSSTSVPLDREVGADEEPASNSEQSSSVSWLNCSQESQSPECEVARSSTPNVTLLQCSKASTEDTSPDSITHSPGNSPEEDSDSSNSTSPAHIPYAETVDNNLIEAVHGLRLIDETPVRRQGQSLSFRNSRLTSRSNVWENDQTFSEEEV